MVAEIALAKVNQMIYVQQGYRAVETGPDSEAANYVNVTDSECELGQWLDHGAGQQHYGHLTTYAKIKQPHEQVHRYMISALEHLRDTWQTSPEIQKQIIEDFKGLEKYSLEINTLLEKVIEENTMGNAV
ncbi:CZB domain-containing protein [methane-oxidizing endosymbiont of Gigantopelta aegis]|uniref:CZB domain-containing protein n=1 Tax=methane-oxidizing endosymbiont of Gigantopelta aegis TaxID=2794938 RepID=UPI003CCA66B3